MTTPASAPLRADKSVVTRWVDGLRFESDTGYGGTADLEGRDGQRGARPSEMLLVALAACTAMDVISILGKKRQRPDAYEVACWGEQRSGHPATFREIVVEHRFDGEALDPEAVRRSIELSATRYCPVTAHISQGDTRISHRFLLRAGSAEHSAEVVVTGPSGAGLEPRA